MTAARSLAEEDQSVNGVTISLNSVAQRAGLTKAGLLYYYGTKEELMLGLVDHTAERWAEMLRKAAGAGPDELTPFDKHRAYVEVATANELSRGDYWICTDTHFLPVLAEPWQRHLGTWLTTEGLSEQATALLDTARFAADGAWMANATGVFPAHNLESVRTSACRLIDDAEVLP